MALKWYLVKLQRYRAQVVGNLVADIVTMLVHVFDKDAEPDAVRIWSL